MADIDLSLSFSLEQASIRNIQRDINRAIKDTSPQLDIELSPNFFRNLRDEVRTLPVEFSQITVDPAAIGSINQLLKDSVTVGVTQIDVRQRAIDNLEREIARRVRQLAVQTDIELGIEGGAVPGRGSLRSGVRSQAAEVGLETGAAAGTAQQAIEQVLQQRIRLEEELNQLIGRRALFEQQTVDQLNRLQDTEINSIQRLEDAREDFRQGLLTAAQATRIANRFAVQGAASRREASESDPQTRGFIEERNRLAQELLGEVETQVESAKQTKQAEDELARTKAALSRIGQIELELLTEATNLQSLRLRTLRLDAQGSAQVQQRRSNLLSFIEDEIQAQASAKASAQEVAEANSQIARLSTIRAQLESEQITAEQARRRSLGIQVDSENANAALVTQERQLLESTIAAARQKEEAVRAQTETNAALDSIAKIEASVANEIISVDRAILAAKRLKLDAEQSGVAGVQEQANRLLASLEEQDRVNQETRELADSQAQAKVLQQRQVELANGLISISSARLSLARTELDDARVGAELIAGARQALEEEIDTQERRVELSREIEADLREASVLRKQTSSELQKEFDAIRAAERVQRDLVGELITSRDAQKQINRLRSSTQERQPENIDPRTITSLRREFDDAVGAAQSLVNRLEASAEAQKQVESANQSAAKITRRIQSIVDRQAAGLLSAENARKQLELVNIDLQGSLGASLRAALNVRKQNFDRLIQEGAAEQELIDAQKEEIEQRRAINNELNRISGFTKAQSDTARDLANQLAREVANRQQITPAGGPGPVGGPGGGQGANVVFSNAADVENFVNQLDPSQLERFTSVIKNTSVATRDAQRATDGFGSSLRRNNDVTGDTNRNLQEGVGLAESFGRQVRIAAVRLLAWATPANLIFQTVSRLRSAVNEIIALDRESRRLIFFRNAGVIITNARTEVDKLGDSASAVDRLQDSFSSLDPSFRAIIKSTNELAVDTGDLAKEFSDTASIARTYGLSIRTVQEALLTVARVGQQTFDSVEGVASAFTDAALSLVRLESGALGATEAVRGLVAIQAQFFGGRGGSVFEDAAVAANGASIAIESVSNAAAILATTSAGSSASVSELVDATTRLGSAFVNLQGLNFPQTVAILGEAFTATGATTGRLATALRQTATLIKQNAEEIRELTGISVANADGTVTGFQAILDVLREVREAGEGLKATEISLLIADRRNVADIAALAQNVDELQASFDRFASPAERINRVVGAQLALFKQNEALANSLEASITNLSTAFKQLVDSEEIREFFRDAISFATSLIDGISGLASSATGLSSVLAPIGGLLVGITGVGILKLVKGFFNLTSSSVRFQEELRRASAEIGKQATSVRGINQLRAQGLISAKQQSAAIRGIGAARQQIAISLLDEQRLIQQIKVLQESEEDNLEEINKLERERNNIIEARAAAQQEEARIIGRTASEGRATELDRRSASRRGNLIAGAVLAIAPLISSTLEKTGFEGLSEGINRAAGVAAIGFGIGGPVGAAILGTTALLTEGFVAAFKKFDDNIGKLNVQEAFQGDARRGLTAVQIGTDTFDLIQNINAAARNFDDEGRRAASAQAKRLGLLKSQLNVLKLNEESGVLNAQDKERIVSLRAQLTEEQNIAKEIAQQVAIRARGIEVLNKARSLRDENREISLKLARGEFSITQAIKAREKFAENAKILASEEFTNVRAVVEARVQAAEATERQVLALRNLEREAAIQNTVQNIVAAIPTSEIDALKIRFELDEASFKRALNLANDRLNVARQRASLESLSSKELEAAQKALVEAEKARNELRIKRIGELVKAEKAIVEGASKEAQAQIKAWESAAKKVTDAFSNIVKEQESLAEIFGKVGELNATSAERSASSIATFLENTGASLSTRLIAASRATQEQLAIRRQTFERQRGTLGDRFTTGVGVSDAVNSLIGSVAEAARTSDKDIFDQRRVVFREEIAEVRERARVQRADFERRIGETRREISIRKDLLQGEIELLQQRFDAERKFNEERRNQQEQFGRLLIESPDKFKEAISDITTATDFFSGITDINVDGLQTILRRSQRLRGAGGAGQEQLRSVLQGLDAAVQFGRSDIISGIGNRQLQQILGRVQVENLGELSDDLKKQEQEANSQSDIQRRIAERQRELIRLAEFDGQVQNEIVRLAQADAEIAVQQRKDQIEKLNNLVGTAESTREEFVSGIKAVVAVLTAQADIGSLETQNSFAQKFANVLQPLLPSTATGGTSERRRGSAETRVIANRLLENLESFISSDVQAAQRDHAEETRRLATETENYTRKLQESASAMDALRQRTDGVTGGASEISSGPQISRLVDSISNQLTPGRFGRSFRFENPEIARIREQAGVAEGGQLTREERNRISQLERQGARRFTGDESDVRQFTRRLLRDDTQFRQTVDIFRDTLGDNKAISDEFIDRARRLRGEGARGRRGVDPEAVQRFLRGAGFEGAAAQATTRGGAAKVLDSFISLSERLANEQGEISRTTQKKIVEILSAELTPGIQKVISDASVAATDNATVLVTEIEGRATDISAALKDAVEKGIPRAFEFVNKNLEASGQNMAENIAKGLEAGADAAAAKIADTKITVDPVAVKAEVSVRTPDAIKASQLTDLMKTALAPLIGDKEKLDRLSKRVTKTIAELQRRTVLPPFIPETPVDSILKEVTPSPPIS
jgi:hypothetical protein